MNQSYLLDKDFLASLDEQQNREIYARITALNIKEQPIEEIEGKVTGGSVNIDGNAAVRRTCSLTMVCQDININEFYWGIKNKFKLEIGLKNNIDSKYPEICWFSQGIYLITGFNTSITTNNCTISISGKDKMCLLNGDIGGQLPSSIDFGTEETLIYNYILHKFNNMYEYEAGKYYILSGYSEYDGAFFPDQIYYTLNDDTNQYETADVFNQFKAGVKYYIKKYQLSYDSYNPSVQYFDQEVIQTKVQIPLYRIIKEAVHAWAKEPYQNIVINDLDTYGLEQMQYRGDTPLFALKAVTDEVYSQMIINENTQCKLVPKEDKVYLENGVLNRDDGIIASYDDITLQNFLTDPDLKAEKATDDIAAEDTNSLSWILLSKGQLGWVPYTVLYLQYGDDAGYKITDLVYNGELIAAIGDTVTSVLDKIKTMLGDFEYFYDLEGRFVFQRKKTFVNTSWNSIEKIEDDSYVEPAAYASPVTYNFIGDKLITAFSNNPALNNLRNDYSVWGTRKGVSGAEIPIHIRYAIDKKPIFYQNFKGTKVYTTDIDLAAEMVIERKKSIITTIIEQAVPYEFEYADNMPSILQKPKRQEDGTFSPGWWDIRDWYNYYIKLTNEDPSNPTNIPNKSMKWYAYNGPEGCVKYSSIYPGSTGYYGTASVWLCVNYAGSNSLSFGHGSGTYGSYWRDCVCYESNYVNGRLVTTKVDPVEIKRMPAPYNGCNDDHTYLYFIETYVKKGYNVYFYNPQFPEGTVLIPQVEEIIEKEVVMQSLEYKATVVDWREIIYQMALDYFRYNDSDAIDEKTNLPIKDIFYQRLAENNLAYYPSGYTGYEQYYTDIQGFWRQLYNPEAEPTFTWKNGKYINVKEFLTDDNLYYQYKQEWQLAEVEDCNTEYYMNYDISYTINNNQLIITNNNSEIAKLREKEQEALALLEPNSEEYERVQQYYNELVEELQPTWLINLMLQAQWINTIQDITERTTKQNELVAILNKCLNACVKESDDNYNQRYWNMAVFNAPETLNFWFDFLDSTTELAEYAVPVVGDRSKTVNDSKITAIYFKQVPDFIFTNNNSFTRDQFEDKGGAYTFLFLPPALEQLFTLSYRGKSAKNELDNLLYQFAYCTENVTITALPVYYLEPNTRIFVYDEDTQVDGEYIVTKITLPLAYNGTMQVTANKAPTRIY